MDVLILVLFIISLIVNIIMFLKIRKLKNQISNFEVDKIKLVEEEIKKRLAEIEKKKNENKDEIKVIENEINSEIEKINSVDKKIEELKNKENVQSIKEFLDEFGIKLN